MKSHQPECAALPWQRTMPGAPAAPEPDAPRPEQPDNRLDRALNRKIFPTLPPKAEPTDEPPLRYQNLPYRIPDHPIDAEQGPENAVFRLDNREPAYLIGSRGILKEIQPHDFRAREDRETTEGAPPADESAVAPWVQIADASSASSHMNDAAPAWEDDGGQGKDAASASPREPLLKDGEHEEDAHDGGVHAFRVPEDADAETRFHFRAALGVLKRQQRDAEEEAALEEEIARRQASPDARAPSPLDELPPDVKAALASVGLTRSVQRGLGQYAADYAGQANNGDENAAATRSAIEQTSDLLSEDTLAGRWRLAHQIARERDEMARLAPVYDAVRKRLSTFPAADLPRLVAQQPGHPAAQLMEMKERLEASLEAAGERVSVMVRAVGEPTAEMREALPGAAQAFDALQPSEATLDDLGDAARLSARAALLALQSRSAPTVKAQLAAFVESDRVRRQAEGLRERAYRSDLERWIDRADQIATVADLAALALSAGGAEPGVMARKALTEAAKRAARNRLTGIGLAAAFAATPEVAEAGPWTDLTRRVVGTDLRVLGTEADPLLREFPRLFNMPGLVDLNGKSHHPFGTRTAELIVEAISKLERTSFDENKFRRNLRTVTASTLDQWRKRLEDPKFFRGHRAKTDGTISVAKDADGLHRRAITPYQHGEMRKFLTMFRQRHGEAPDALATSEAMNEFLVGVVVAHARAHHRAGAPLNEAFEYTIAGYADFVREVARTTQVRNLDGLKVGEYPYIK